MLFHFSIHLLDGIHAERHIGVFQSKGGRREGERKKKRREEKRKRGKRLNNPPY